MTKNNRPGRYYELDPKGIRELAMLAGIEYDPALKSGVPVEKVYRMSGRKQTSRRGRFQGNSRGDFRSNRKTPTNNHKSTNRKKVKHAKHR